MKINCIQTNIIMGYLVGTLENNPKLITNLGLDYQ